jgi:hypothetical protein
MNNLSENCLLFDIGEWKTKKQETHESYNDTAETKSISLWSKTVLSATRFYLRLEKYKDTTG